MDYFNDDLDTYLDRELHVVSLNKLGKPRKRKPKEPALYFTQATDDAITQYILSNDDEFRNKIYTEHIKYAFYKLAENIIHTFKFYYTDTNTIEELKHEVIVFLLEKITLFDQSKNLTDRINKIFKSHKFICKHPFSEFYKGELNKVTQHDIDSYLDYIHIPTQCIEELNKLTPPKGYSYFGTIAKRYLINYNKNNYQKLQEHVGIEDIEEDVEHSYHGEEVNLDQFLSQYVLYIDKNLNQLFPKKQDAKTVDAVIELFRKRETLEIFNKKALYIYIREMVDVSTPQITKITKRLDSIRTRLFNNYYKNGTIYT